MSLDTQLQIRENSLSVQEYIKDLNSWLKQPTSVPKPVRDITPCTVRDLKEKANLKVISKEWTAAANLYTEAIEICKTNRGQAPLLSTLLVNRSLCYLKTGKHSKCCKDCNESLSLKKDNPKAFFRRALSLMGMSRWNEARADLDDCLEMVRSDTQMTQAVMHELSRLETLMVDEAKRINLDARRRVHTIVPPWVRAEPEDEEENLRILQIVGTATEITVPTILPVEHLDPVKEKYIPRAIRMRNKPGSCYLLTDLRPGGIEARAIQRDFEWRNKLRDIEKNLKAVDSELKGACNAVVEPKNRRSSFDADNIVMQVEDEAKEQWGSLPDKSSEFRMKLQKAHDIMSKKSISANKSDEVPKPNTLNASKNEWETFARLEQERREFMEASYRRFRCGPVPVAPVPMGEHFEYDHAEIEVTPGEFVQHPVAFVREPKVSGKRDVERFRSDVNRFTVGINTDASDSQGIKDSRLPSVSPLEIDRKAFLCDLVSKKSMNVSPLIPGRMVEVSYYGVFFPGIIIRRNIGSGTVTIRFDDETENDFPLHAIRFRN